MTRRELRENTFKMLFRIEFYETDELPEQMRLFEEENPALKEADLAYLKQKCDEVISHLEEIDAAVNEASEGWKTSRMGKVDLTLIRLAVYEIRYEDEIPYKVSINEAVELAKKYGTEDSPSFVNGILAKFAA
ncbi:MAG: transcription antitermination factor NusB [Agathobacter sp.]